MRIASAGRAAALLALTLTLGGALAAPAKDVDAAMASGGLQKVRVKGLELVYVRPGASLAAYQRVKIEPVDVSFDKSWNPNRTGSNIKVSAEEREQIKSEVAKIVEEVFAKELQAKSTYQVVNEAGADVLRVKASIVNLYVNAPDADGFGRSKTFTSSAGSMTLMAELDDSTSGQVLARVADRREASGIGRMQLTNSMVNEDELRTTAAGWARILRQALDKAHGIGEKK
jgi:Protein of unknown function (DUF3313)